MRWHKRGCRHTIAESLVYGLGAYVSHLHFSFPLLLIETASNNQIPHQSRDVIRTSAIHDLSRVLQVAVWCIRSVKFRFV